MSSDFIIPVSAGEMYDHRLRVHFWVEPKNGTWIYKIFFKSNHMGFRVFRKMYILDRWFPAKYMLHNRCLK